MRDTVAPLLGVVPEPAQVQQVGDFVPASARTVATVMYLGRTRFPAALAYRAGSLFDDAAVAGRDRFRATHRGTVLTMVSNRANPKQ
jgi:hypothetical protein